MFLVVERKKVGGWKRVKWRVRGFEGAGHRARGTTNAIWHVDTLLRMWAPCNLVFIRVVARAPCGAKAAKHRLEG